MVLSSRLTVAAQLAEIRLYEKINSPSGSARVFCGLCNMLIMCGLCYLCMRHVHFCRAKKPVPACGRASFVWRWSLYRCAEKLFQRCGKGSSASLTALSGVAVCIFMRFRCVSGRPRFPVCYFLLSIFFTVRRLSAVLPCALSAPVKTASESYRMRLVLMCVNHV